MYSNLTVIVPNVLVRIVALPISCFFNFDLTCLINHPHWIIDLWCPKSRYHLWNLNLLFKKGNIKTVARKLATRCFVATRCICLNISKLIFKITRSYISPQRQMYTLEEYLYQKSSTASI